jgi:hypothetical protein
MQATTQYFVIGFFITGFHTLSKILRQTSGRQTHLSLISSYTSQWMDHIVRLQIQFRRGSYRFL